MKSDHMLSPISPGAANRLGKFSLSDGPRWHTSPPSDWVAAIGANRTPGGRSASYRTCGGLKIFCCLALVLLTGCPANEEITVREMPAWKTGLPAARQFPAAMPASNTVSGPRRMVVAIASLPTATWFFKIDDEKMLVDAAEPAWTKFLQSVRFDEQGQPQWELPDSWQTTPGNRDRLATLKIPNSNDHAGSKPTIDLAISSLSANQELLSNVNRWRGQLGLSPSTADQLSANLKKIAYVGGEFIVFDGQNEANSGSAPHGGAPNVAAAGVPAAGGKAAAGNAAAGSAAPAPSPTEIPLEYQKPESWQETPGNLISILKFKKTAPPSATASAPPESAAKSTTPETAAEVAIAVTPMALRNTWEESVASWTAEANLDAVEPPIALEATESIQISGLEAKFIILQNKNSDTEKAIIGARVEHNDRAWYFKMVGPRKQLLETENEFRQFLGSIKFK